MAAVQLDPSDAGQAMLFSFGNETVAVPRDIANRSVLLRDLQTSTGENLKPSLPLDKDDILAWTAFAQIEGARHAHEDDAALRALKVSLRHVAIAAQNCSQAVHHSQCLCMHASTGHDLALRTSCRPVILVAHLLFMRIQLVSSGWISYIWDCISFLSATYKPSSV